jgi:hypothetical protein
MMATIKIWREYMFFSIHVYILVTVIELFYLFFFSTAQMILTEMLRQY